MGILDKAKPVKDIAQSALWVIYGRSASGKTTLASTFPKPLLCIAIGDDGQESIRDIDGVNVLQVNDVAQLTQALQELETDRKYATVLIDTFSLVVNEWIEAEVASKKKKMTQQAWGELKTDTETIIRRLKKLANSRNIILTCHEVTDTVEGLEDELLPDVRPNIGKGSRTYLEGMANYGIHTTVLKKEKEMPDGTTKTVIKFAVHLNNHPYYWVKTQKSQSVKLPTYLIDPSYDKIVSLIKGDKI